MCGEGTFGKVAHFVNDRGEHRAIKKLKTDACERYVMREVLTLQHMKHGCIVQLLEIYEHQRHKYLVFEYMDTDLHRVIRSSQPLTENHMKYLMLQIIRGVAAIHRAGIMHRDLKPANILVNKNCTVKIADFGLAREIGETTATPPDDDKVSPLLSQYMQTRWYRAPEVILQGLYGRPIDLWSVGCILAEMIQRFPLLPKTNNFDQMQRIVSIIGMPTKDDIQQLVPRSRTYSEDVDKRWDFIERCSKLKIPNASLKTNFPQASSNAMDLLTKLLHFNQFNRITAEEALRHLFFCELSTHPNSSLPILPFDRATTIPLTDVRQELRVLFDSSTRKRGFTPLENTDSVSMSDSDEFE